MPDAQLKPKGCPFGNNYQFCTGEPPIEIFLGVLVLSRLDPKAQSEYRSDFCFLKPGASKNNFLLLKICFITLKKNTKITSSMARG
jgi:hypothetical protein